ncbi:MAG TPA: permease, partial [Rhodospirillales bacterium]|nr:permease [Rhodospirillales bacterium]
MLTAAFFAALWLPFDAPRFEGSLHEAFALLQWYAREHVVSCLLPALMIAGAIAVFISQGAVIRLLGADANKAVAYGTASVSGTILAVCSCTVLPLFGGLYRRGAGLGPAIAFLYSGPAINVLAVVLTAKVLGYELGVARAIGAVAFSLVIGLAMAGLYRREERERKA